MMLRKLNRVACLAPVVLLLAGCCCGHFGRYRSVRLPASHCSDGCCCHSAAPASTGAEHYYETPSAASSSAPHMPANVAPPQPQPQDQSPFVPIPAPASRRS